MKVHLGGHRTGLTRREKVPSLLSMVGGKSTKQQPADDDPPAESDSDDSRTGLSLRGTIQRTTFTAAKNEGGSSRLGGASTNGSRSLRSSQSTVPRSSTKRSSAPEDISSASEDDAPGLHPATDRPEASSFSSQPRYAGATYGQSSKKRPNAYPSRNGRQVVTKKLKSVPVLSQSPAAKKEQFFNDQQSVPRGITPSPRKSFKVTGRLPISPPSAPLPKGPQGRKVRAKNKRSKDEVEHSQESQPRTFQLPDRDWLSLAGNSSAADALDLDGTQPQPGELSQLGISPIKADLHGVQQTQCPLCGGFIQDDLQEPLKKAMRMTVQEQTDFCHVHRKKSAQEEWVAKGFPDIDWLSLDNRIAKHHDALQSILEGEDSHYRTAYSKKVSSGKSRTLLKEESNLIPGYYGTRGLRTMTESITEHFSSELRHRAIGDRLVSARGHTMFVQNVLVPELAIRLIMEDLTLTEEGHARVMLQESAWVGELINEDIGDTALSDLDRGSKSSLSDVEGEPLSGNSK
jgi:hypothetical protein